MMELVAVVSTLIVCGLGVTWLIYDLQKQIKTYEERCESKEEDK